MSQILLVEDSNAVGSLVKKSIESKLDFEVYWFRSYAETELFLNKKPPLFLALLDYNLPDAPNGEIISRVLGDGIPSIVFTGEFRQEVRDHIWSQDVIDYVLKDSIHNLDYLTSLVRRIYRNRGMKVLVVDDSITTRNIISKLMRVHQYQVITAENGREALDVLAENPDIKLVLTDYNMPVMDGFALTRAIRETTGKEKLAIIGLSAQGNHLLSAQFIKAGANDFLNKPFVAEEFYCRITQNVEGIEYINKIQDMADRDYLTGLNNRAYFFRTVPALLSACSASERPGVVLMLDIDHFKQVNDTYGHDAGDEVLCVVATLLQKHFSPPHIVSRFGGEEFCVFLSDEVVCDPGRLLDLFLERVRTSTVSCNGNTISVTVSAGVAMGASMDIDALIKKADAALYKAKASGRDQWCLSDV